MSFAEIKGKPLAFCLDLLDSGLSGAAMLSEITSTADHPESAQKLGLMFTLVYATRALPD